jgi:hypothetical protein
MSLWSALGGSLLSGKRKPLFLKARPVSLSLGTPVWQKLQLRPVCLAKLGVASAFGVGNINAKAMGAAAKAPPSAKDLNRGRSSLAERCASTFFPRTDASLVNIGRRTNLQLADATIQIAACQNQFSH